jgi:hypothetical protein
MRTGKGEDIVYLKFFVYFMGLALVLGCIFLSYMVYQRNAIALLQHSPQSAAEACVGGTMQLNTDGEMELSIQDGNRLFLMSKLGSNSQELIILDYCQNKVISRISFDNTSLNAEIGGVSSAPLEEETLSTITIDSDNLSKAG